MWNNASFSPMTKDMVKLKYQLLIATAKINGRKDINISVDDITEKFLIKYELTDTPKRRKNGTTATK